MQSDSSKLKIRFLQYNESLHLYQLYTGFGLLEKKGIIDCIFNEYSDYSLNPYGLKIISLILNDKIKLVYDTEDFEQINPDRLDWCDFYFKRSFSTSIHSKISGKIHPLGLYYYVFASHISFYQRVIQNINHKNIWSRGVIKLMASDSTLISRIFALRSGRYINSLPKFEFAPIIQKTPKIIFMAQVWDPKRVKSLEKVEDRFRVNEMRCNCIRLLRQEYRGQFIGGIFPSEYALANYKDVVIQDERLFHKQNYLSKMQGSDIGIASTGLLKSNGTKLAEYVAASKAIVSEKLYFEVPGSFLPGKNYLKFTTPEECVERVQQLVEDDVFRFEMMKKNKYYYDQYMRPDMLVWNSIQRTMQYF